MKKLVMVFLLLLPLSVIADGASWKSKEAKTLFENSKTIKIDNKTNAILLSETNANLIEKYFRIAFKNAGYNFCTDDCPSDSLLFKLNVIKYRSTGTDCRQGYSSIAFNYQLYKSDGETLLLKGKYTRKGKLMLDRLALEYVIKNTKWIK